MNDFDNFDSIFDSMTSNYNQLEQIMVDVYQQLQSNPDNYKLLEALGEVAKSMISTHREFASTYCDSHTKDYLISRLDDKEEALKEALGDSKRKTI